MAVVLSPFPADGDPNRAAAIAWLRQVCAGYIADDDELAAAVGETASALIESYAPRAPQPIKNEATVRFVGYLVNSDWGGFAKEPSSVGGADGGEYVVNHAPVFRNSGAAALLTRWKVRRARAIG